MTGIELFRIAGRFVMNSDEARSELSEINDQGEQTGETMTDMGDKIKAAGAVAVAAIAAMAGTIVALSNGAMEATAEINKFAQVTGTTTDEFQRWDGVMKSVGYSMEQANGDFAALAEKAVEATSGIGENAEIFKKLNVQLKNANGTMRTQGQLFDDVIEGLQGMENATERNAIATALLSTTGEELTPILNMTNKELAELKGNMSIISEDDLKKAADYKKSWDSINQKFDVFKTQLGISVMPIMEKFFDVILDNEEEIAAFVTGTLELFSVIIGTLVDNLDLVIPLVAGLASGIAALKILEVINVLMGIFNATLWANPITWVVVVIAALIAAIVLLIVKFDEFATDVEWVWDKIREGFGKMVNGIYDFFKKLIDKIKKKFHDFVDEVKDKFKDFGQAFKDMLTAPILFVEKQVDKFVDGVKKKINWVLDMVNSVTGALNSVSAAIGVDFNIPELKKLKLSTETDNVRYSNSDVRRMDKRELPIVSARREDNSYGIINVNMKTEDIEDIQTVNEFFNKVDVERGAY